MTDADFLAWLNDPTARRTTLIEVTPLVGGVPTTLYLATVGYTTGAADAPAHTPYVGVCSSGITFSEALSLTGDPQISVGDIEFHNFGGARDAWLGYVWTNTPVRAWIGDVRWPRADFRMIFSGRAANLDSKSRETLNIKLRDNLQRLNAPVTEHKLGGTTTNKDEIVPVGLGEVANVTPLLVDPAQLEYQVHDGATEWIFEVRDNGLPVAFTDLGNGRFRLNQGVAGTITVSFQGDTTGGYANTVAPLVQRLATSYGKVPERFALAEIDSANFAAFDAAHPQPVGLYIGDRTNVLAACQQLAGSLGAQLVPSATGQLRLLQVALPPPGTPTAITPAMIAEKSIKIVNRPDVKAAVKLGFCKNWTVQDDLQTALPVEHKARLAAEWATETAVDSAVQATYKLSADPVQQDTLLLRRTDAAAEAARQLALWKVQRTVYEFEGLAPCLTLQLGDAVQLQNSRFGLANGQTGMVISRALNSKTARTTLQVLV
jgi:hypothetical protein